MSTMKPPCCGSALRRQIERLAVLALQAQRHLVRVAGGEHQRRTLHGQHQDVLARAVDLLRVDRMQRRQLCTLDGRQRHHQHRLGIAKRRRRVQRQTRARRPAARTSAGMYW